MIPKQENIMEGISFTEKPSLTYQMSLEKNKITSRCDNLEAMKQAAYKILETERYDCPIYSWNYGVELKSLFGMPVSFCIPEIERRITEALMQDDRVERVYGFSFDIPKKGVIHAVFRVQTTKGTIEAEKEVSV